MAGEATTGMSTVDKVGLLHRALTVPYGHVIKSPLIRREYMCERRATTRGTNKGPAYNLKILR